jgi:hypothetical protein
MAMTDHDRWARKFPRHAWALEELDAGPFKNSLANQLNMRGHLSDKQMSLLWERADVLERIGLGEVKVPKDQSWVDIAATITKAAEMDVSEYTYRVAFKTAEGWRGRFDLSKDRMALIEEISTRASHKMRIKGKVVWVRETFVVLEDDGVAVELG